MSQSPLIIYVPGLKPKPEAEVHQQQLLRCLSEGIRRVDAEVHAEFTAGDAFRLVSWTHDFYQEYRDIDLDLADIDMLLSKVGPSPDDIATVTSWKRRLTRWLFRSADYLPFLIPHFATAELQIHLRDFRKYLGNANGIAEAAREKVRQAIENAALQGRPTLVLGHSMGSVIAYESLWQLSRQQANPLCVDLLTSGSPLGQGMVQRHLMGMDAVGEKRYPANIRHWTNIAAVGELTAIDMQLKNDFAEMLEWNLVEDIRDLEAFNYYYMNGVLNVHAEYGYLVNNVTARAICAWWRTVSV